MIARYYGLDTAATGGTPTTLNAGNALYYRKFTTVGSGTPLGGITNPADQYAIFSGDISGSYGLTKSGLGTLELQGNNTINGGVVVNQGTLITSGNNSFAGITASLTGIYRQTGGTTTVNSGTLSIGSNATYKLEAGTLRTNGISRSGAFDWGAATLTMTQEAGTVVGTGIDRTGTGGAASGPVVKEGTVINVLGGLTTTSGSVLDLGHLYQSAAMLYDRLSISSGTLDLSAANDTLHFEINPYRLRPYSPNAVGIGDWGTLVLASATSINQTFDNFTGVTGDGIGWRQLGSEPGDLPFNGAANMPFNTWYLEYVASGYNDENQVASSLGVILFHYKVDASVPEPASASMVLLGVVFLRTLSRKKIAPEDCPPEM